MGRHSQILANRYNLAQTNPGLSKQLGLPSGSVQYVIEHSSADWTGTGTLSSAKVTDLKALLDDPVVGDSNSAAAGACGQLLSAVQTAYNAIGAFDGRAGRVGGNTTGVSTNTYWFFRTGTPDPVNHNFWNTSFAQDVGPFRFENYIGSKPQPPTKSPPPRGPQGPAPPRGSQGPRRPNVN